MRIGIMGGTFDPIHMGHLAIARAAAEQLDLDRVLFIPTGNPNFKQGRRIAPAHDRARMVELAIADEPLFEVDGREVERPGVTYTIETLQELRESHPDDSLFLILGADSAATLPKWKKTDEIAGMCTIVVAQRPGYPSVSANDTALGGLIAYNVEVVDAPRIDVSSSSVRERIACGDPFQELVPQGVSEYIVEHNLYGAVSCD